MRKKLTVQQRQKFGEKGLQNKRKGYKIRERVTE